MDIYTALRLTKKCLEHLKEAKKTIEEYGNSPFTNPIKCGIIASIQLAEEHKKYLSKAIQEWLREVGSPTEKGVTRDD